MKIMKCSEISLPRISALIYGVPGRGKTTLCGMLPGKTLIIDVDNRGINVLRGKTNVDYIPLREDLSDLKATLDELEKLSPFPYDTLVIDSLSELEKNMLTVLGRSARNNGAPELAHYNQVQYKIADYVRRFRALPCNTVFTAWETAKEVTCRDGSKVQIFKPQLSGNTADCVCGLVDIVGRIEINPQNAHRFVRLGGGFNVVAKDRLYKRDICEFPDLLSEPKEQKITTKEGKK